MSSLSRGSTSGGGTTTTTITTTTTTTTGASDGHHEVIQLHVTGRWRGDITTTCDDTLGGLKRE